jgi:hypothetical protein
MIKKLLSIAAVAAIALSANAEELQLSGGWNTNLPLVDVKMTGTSQWGEYRLYPETFSTTTYKGFRVEYSDLQAADAENGWQMKIEGTENHYLDLDASASSISSEFGFDGDVKTFEIQTKAANNSIVINKVVMIKADGSEEQVQLGKANWGVTLAAANPFAPTMIYVGQWGTASVLKADGSTVTYTKGGEPITLDIKFGEAIPVSLVVDFDSVTYGNIAAGSESASFTITDESLGEKEGISKVEIKADDSATSNNVIKFSSLTLTTGTNSVSSIAVDNTAPVEYFNLQGVRVANPQNGLFIRRQGNTATKVLVK